MYHYETIKDSRPLLSKTVRWYIFYTFVAYLFNITFNIGLMAGSAATIKSHIGLSDLEYSCFFSVYAFGRFCGAVLFAITYNSVSRKYLMVLGTFCKCVSLIPFYCSDNGLLLLILRIVAGFGNTLGNLYASVWLNQFGVKKWLGFQRTLLGFAGISGRLAGLFYDIYMGGKSYKIGLLLNGACCGLLSFLFLLYPSAYFSKNLSPIQDDKDLLTEDERQFYSIYNIRESDPSERSLNLCGKNMNIFTNGVWNCLLISRTIVVSTNTTLLFFMIDYCCNILGGKDERFYVVVYFGLITFFLPFIGGKLGGKLVKLVGGYKDKNSFILLFIFNALAIGAFTPGVFQNEWRKFLIFCSFYYLFSYAVIPCIVGIQIASLKDQKLIKRAGIVTVLCVNLLGNVPLPLAYTLSMDYFKDIDKKIPMKLFVCLGYVGLLFILIAWCFRCKYESNEEEKKDIEMQEK